MATALATSPGRLLSGVQPSKRLHKEDNPVR